MRILRRISCGVVFLLVLTSCGEGSSRTETSAVEVLAAALAGTSEATSYRIETSSAQTISSTALGIESSTEIDRDRPATSSEVTPSAVHTVIDLRALLGPIAEEIDEPVGLEMWLSDGITTMDTTTYQVILDLNPFADLGPFRPGVFTIDEAKAAALDANDILTAVGGSSVDLAQMAEALPAALRDVRTDASAPGVYRGFATFVGINEAMGVNVEDMAKSLSAGMTLIGDVDVDALVEAYVGFFESTETEVVVTVENGLVSDLEYELDIGGIVTHLFEDGRAEEIFGLSPAEVTQTRLAFADTVWIQRTLTRFISTPDLVVDPAPEATEDRTEEIVEFLLASGAFD